MADQETIDQLVTSALEKDEVLEKIIEELSGSSRRARQQAAKIVSEIAKKDAKRIAPYSEQITDSLNRPEAQTRWECLDALTELVAVESRLCDKAIPGAEDSLFDEENGLVRLAAMRFLCRLGSTTENRSEKTWPIIDEGIQCYHGDPEFPEMLAAVIGFSEGKLAPEVKEQLADRMSFDATNGKGALKNRAQQIEDNLK